MDWLFDRSIHWMMTCSTRISIVHITVKFNRSSSICGTNIAQVMALTCLVLLIGQYHHAQELINHFLKLLDSCTLTCWCRIVASSHPTPTKITLHTSQLFRWSLKYWHPKHKAHVRSMTDPGRCSMNFKALSNKGESIFQEFGPNSARVSCLKNPDARNRWPQYTVSSNIAIEIYTYINTHIYIYITPSCQNPI